MGTYTGDILEIPSTYEGLPVTQIGSSAFWGKQFTEIIIPESIVHIYNYAFARCSNVVSIQFLAENCKNLGTGAGAFAGCGQDTEGITLYVGSKVTRLPDGLFDPDKGDAVKITEIVFADDCVCTYIGEDCFRYATSLKEVTIPDTVTELGSSCFLLCDALEEVHLPASLTVVPEGIFCNCEDFEGYPSTFDSVGSETAGVSFIVGASVERIPARLFVCYRTPANLTSVVFEDGSACTEIGNRAFNKLENLQTVHLGESLSNISNGAFYNCTSLTTINLPASLQRICPDVFEGDKALVPTFESVNTWYVVRDEGEYHTIGDEVDAAAVSDPATAAKYLYDDDDYSNCYWHKG